MDKCVQMSIRQGMLPAADKKHLVHFFEMSKDGAQHAQNNCFRILPVTAQKSYA